LNDTLNVTQTPLVIGTERHAPIPRNRLNPN
jgi:hypothetical protein